MKLLAIDPGVRTGVAGRGFDNVWLSQHALPGGAWCADTEKGGVLCPEAGEIVRLIHEADVVIVESWEVQGRTEKLARFYDSPEWIGVIKREAARGGTEFVLSQKDVLKPEGPYGDAALKRMGFYIPGPDHKRDATRHLLRYAAGKRLFRLTRGEWRA